ncbi:MAG: hypothetical protein HRU19_04830 [Pseudobacteriovorax sp.]|nr:hypothetical protein [Pseudobacteriovorax sp.]
MNIIRLGIIALFSTMLMLTGCSKPPKISASGGGADNGSGGPGDAADVEQANGFPTGSLAMFSSNLYEPVIEQQCKKCHHAETNQNDTAENAFAYFTDGVRANYQKPEFSSTVEKVLSGHNCWSGDCVEDSATILAGIEAWFAEMKAAGWVPPSVTYAGGNSATVAFNSGAPYVPEMNPAEYIGGPITMATTANSWATPATDDPDGALAEYVAGTLGQNNNNPANQNAGNAVFTFDVQTPGEYFVWVRTKMIDNDQNQLFVSNITDAANPIDLEFDNDTEVTAEAWGWRQLMITDENDNRVPGTFNLAAGPATIRLTEREGGVRVNYVILTPKPDPNLQTFSEKFYDVTTDVSELVGVDAKVIVTLWEKAQAEDQEKIIGIKEMRIESAQPIHVKGIFPVINDFYQNDHATYTQVDGTFGGSDVRADQIIQTGGATATTWRGDYAADSFNLGFELIEVAQ